MSALPPIAVRTVEAPAVATFPAPGLHARRGCEQLARIADHPVGHANIFHAKRLPVQHGSPGGHGFDRHG